MWAFSLRVMGNKKDDSQSCASPKPAFNEPHYKHWGHILSKSQRIILSCFKDIAGHSRFGYPYVSKASVTRAGSLDSICIHLMVIKRSFIEFLFSFPTRLELRPFATPNTSI